MKQTSPCNHSICEVDPSRFFHCKATVADTCYKAVLQTFCFFKAKLFESSFELENVPPPKNIY